MLRYHPQQNKRGIIDLVVKLKNGSSCGAEFWNLELVQVSVKVNFSVFLFDSDASDDRVQLASRATYLHP